MDVALIFASTSSYWLTVASFRSRFWRSCWTFFRYICDMKQSKDVLKMEEDSIKVCMTSKQIDADAKLFNRPPKAPLPNSRHQPTAIDGKYK